MSLWDKLKDAITTDEAAEKAGLPSATAEEKAQADTARQEAEATAAQEAQFEADHKAEEKAQKARQDAAAGEVYTVKAGDTLSGIGQRFGVDWREIARINDVDNPDMIFPGQKFTIPQK